jgi:hypothetical protein
MTRHDAAASHANWTTSPGRPGTSPVAQDKRHTVPSTQKMTITTAPVVWVACQTLPVMMPSCGA